MPIKMAFAFEIIIIAYGQPTRFAEKCGKTGG
jgi:hypothetical protein